MANLQKDWLSEVLFAQKISSILEEEKVKWDLQRGGLKPVLTYMSLCWFIILTWHSSGAYFM